MTKQVFNLKTNLFSERTLLSNLSTKKNRTYSDSEPETQRSEWFGRWPSKRKTFENLKLKVGWPDELPEIDVSEIERIYLDENYYQLLPFRSNRTYTRKVMSKFLGNVQTENEPITERSGASSPSNRILDRTPNRTSDRTLDRTSKRTTNSNKNVENQTSALIASSGLVTDSGPIASSSLVTDSGPIASSSRCSEETTSIRNQPNFHPEEPEEPQIYQEDSDNEGVFSRLRSRLVDSDSQTSSNSSKSSNQTNASKDRPAKTRRNLTEKNANIMQAPSSSQRSIPKNRTPINRESSLIKQRLLKKQVWLNEQASLLSDMNANYLNDRYELDALGGYSDEDDCGSNQESGQDKSSCSDDPSNSVVNRRTSNRTKNLTKLFTAGGGFTNTTTTTKTRTPTRRKAKENVNNQEIRFAAISQLDFSDLDDLEVEQNEKALIHELDSLKAPTKPMYLFVALLFLSIFAFKLVNAF